MLTLAAPASRPEVYVLRRGATVCGEGEPARRALRQRLARSVAEPALVASFDGGVTAYPPGAVHQVSLAGWVRSHLESQLDAALADRMVRELAGTRLALRRELAPEPLDEADRRMVAALAEPRRLDEIWPLARVPRFRLLAFVHFARSTGALVGPEPRATPPWIAPLTAIEARRRAALRLLEIDGAADAETVKRAYRRLARALHPDLQPEADDRRRRLLERRFAEVTAAYDALVDP